MRSQAWLGRCGAVRRLRDARPGPEVTGKPVGEFFDELKAELREVHWRVRGRAAACGSASRGRSTCATRR